jgi:hypothetical protein
MNFSVLRVQDNYYMGKQKKKTRFKTRIARATSKSRIIDVKPEELANYVHQAELQVLPVIKELEVSAGAAIFLLAQYTQALISGNPQITLESATTITDSVIALWQTDSYHPSAQYPFTLEETLQDLREDLKAKMDYSKHIQPFAPSHETIPTGVGQLAAGIALHPKNLLWQVWIIADGPCALLGAYRDQAEAQKSLERIINISRYGDVNIEKHGDVAIDAWHLYRELISQGDGKPEQFPYDMMAYILENIHFYMIDL